MKAIVWDLQLRVGTVCNVEAWGRSVQVIRDEEKAVHDGTHLHKNDAWPEQNDFWTSLNIQKNMADSIFFSNEKRIQKWIGEISDDYVQILLMSPYYAYEVSSFCEWF